MQGVQPSPGIGPNFVVDPCGVDSKRSLVQINALMQFKRSKLTAVHQIIFHCIGSFIGRYYKQCCVIFTVLAVALSSCNVLIRFNDDFRSGYSQLDPQSQKEHDIFLNFSRFKKQPYTIMLAGESVDGGSMLRTEQFLAMRDEVERGLDMKLNITEKRDGKPFAPQTLRSMVIHSSDVQFLVIEKALTDPEPTVKLDYPAGRLRDQKVLMAPIIYGYHNGSAKTLTYFFAFDGSSEYLDYVKKVELLWSEQLKADKNNITKMRLFGDAIVNDEISASAFGACPYLFTGSILMLSFVFLTMLRRQKGLLIALYLTFWTIFCPLLAGGCAMAVLSLLRYPINCVTMITPFLVLGVGVDDTFITVHHWYQSQEQNKIARLCSVLVNIGPSVTLTSFTNVSAFLVGSILSVPDLKLFCLSSALAFFLDWILQLFLFTPTLMFLKDPEKANNMEKKPTKPAAVVYAEWLRAIPNRVALIVFILVFWMVSVYGGVSMEENFSPEKTFNSQSFLAQSLAQNEEMFRDHEMIKIIVHQMPVDMKTLNERMEQFKSIDYLCKDFPTWLDEYDAEGLGDNHTNTEEYFRNVGLFLIKHPGVLKDVKFEYQLLKIFKLDGFAFDYCVEGFGTWRERALMLQDLRTRLPEGFSVYVSDSAVLALVISTREAVLKSVVITLLCMAVICLLFIPSLRVAVPAILSVASITIGVIGGLYLWGADLDTIILVDIVMAVGLTVDFSAHISYRFSKCSDVHKPEEVAKVIQAVAIPSAEAALTTVLVVAPLYFYNVYIYVTFAKTIILIAAIGLVHTMVVVPLIVSLIR